MTGSVKTRISGACALRLGVTAILLAVVFLVWRGWQGVEVERPMYHGPSEVPDLYALTVSRQCAVCHEKEFHEWAGSHHAWAHRAVDPDLDRVAFADREVRDGPATWLFYGGENPRLTWRDENGMEKDLPVPMIIGLTPLVQPVVETQPGRYQVPDMAWDPERMEWFSIFGDEQRRPEEWGHWTRRGMNWNSQCAYCHFTDFRKNYDHEKDRYTSTWTEPGVGCTQCHGPVKNTHSLSSCMIDNTRKFSSEQWMDSCATCHARRAELDEEFAIGDSFHDHYQLTLPDQPGMFYPDGQQLDEVYLYNTLKMSRMGHAGVHCMDCHDPHSGLTLYEPTNNQLCMQCHGTGRDGATPIHELSHMFHEPGTEGGRCVDCHMPHTTYMARDPRRDHSFVIPDPVLTQEIGVPNACSNCHQEEGLEWAIEWTEAWWPELGEKRAHVRERARAIHAVHEGDQEAWRGLLPLLEREEITAWQATLLRLLAFWADREGVPEAAERYVGSEDPVVRAAAGRVLASVDEPGAKWRELLRDEVRLVRYEAAWHGLHALDRNSPMWQEVERVALHMSDQPSGAMQMARLDGLRGRTSSAEEWYQRALERDQTSTVPPRDFAVFLSGQGRLNEAIRLLQEADEIGPRGTDPDISYLLALGLAEQGRMDEAAEAFAETLRRDPRHGRAAYNLGLLYAGQGRDREAIEALLRAEEFFADSPDAPYARATIHFRRGEADEAEAAAREALRRRSDHEPSRRLLEAIRRR